MGGYSHSLLDTTKLCSKTDHTHHRLLHSSRCLASLSLCTTPCLVSRCGKQLFVRSRERGCFFPQEEGLTSDLEWLALTQRHRRLFLSSCEWTRPLGTIIQSTISHVSAGKSCQDSQDSQQSQGSEGSVQFRSVTRSGFPRPLASQEQMLGMGSTAEGSSYSREVPVT